MNNFQPDRNISPILTIAGSAAFLLFGYEFIRSVSSSLFIGYYGAHRLPWVMTLGPVGTLLLVYGYAALLSFFGARRALLLSSFFAAAMIAACFFLLRRGFAPAAAFLYVFREAYIVVLIEQYWSFINSTVSGRKARLVNGPITGFGSVGAIAGAAIVSACAKQLGTETLLFFAAGSLVPAGILSDVAHRLAGEPQPTKQEQESKHGQLSLGLFRSNSKLTMLFFLIFLTQAVSTALDLRFSGLVEQAFAEKNARTSYLGGFYRDLNIVAFVLQFAAAPLALRFIALRMIHAAIPLVHLVVCAVLIFHPSLFTGAIAFLLFKAFDYSLFRAAKEILYIPLSFDARYRAKSMIDAFGYRFSKGAVGGMLALAGSLLGRRLVNVTPAVALAAAVLWLPLVLRLTSGDKAKSDIALKSANG